MKFDELSSRTKKHVIEKFRKYMHEDFDASLLTDFFADRLEEAGFPSDDIRWRLSYSQGDGVAFYGKFDIQEYLEKNKLQRRYASLFAPTYPEEDELRPLGKEQHEQAQVIADGMRDLDHQVEVRSTKNCYLIDVFQVDANEDAVDWLVTFCVANVKPQGYESNVFVESEKKSGIGEKLFKQARLEKYLEGEGHAQTSPDSEIPIEQLDCWIENIGGHHYHHWNTMRVAYELRGSSEMTKEQQIDLKHLVEHIQKHVKDLSKDFERQGYADIEYQTSDEAITESIESGDYDFDEDGNRA